MLAPSKHTDAVAVEDTGTRQLPEGWASTTLGEACLPVDKASPTQRPDEIFTYLDIASIDNAQLRIVSPRTWLGKDAPSRARQRVKAGSILFSTVRTYLKNIAMVPAELDGQIASTGFCVLSPSDQMNAGFVFYFVQHDEFVARVNPLQRGTSYPAVRDSDVLSQEVPLAPIAEQHRIVAEIEKQFTRLYASVAALKRVQANLKRYRASVLKAACEGKLVSTEAELARAEGRDYEPADRLLERILTERRARWEAQEKRRGRYKEPVGPDATGLPELPEGWVWVTVGQLSSRIEYGTSTKASSVPSGIPILRMGNIQDGELNFSDLKYLEGDHPETQKTILGHGDLLFNRTNSAELVGKSAVYKDWHPEACFASYLIRVSFLPDIAPDYVCTFINSRHGRAYIAQVRNQQVGQANVNGTKLAAMPIPLPPLAEQCRIVAEVERCLSVIQQTEASVEANLTRAERLRQSILKQAFSGKLVPQDPNDEPASVLLERIRTGREAAQTASKPKSRTKRRTPRSSPERQLVLGVQEKTS